MKNRVLTTALVLFGLLFLNAGCEHLEYNSVEIINNSNYQMITVTTNGNLQEQNGQTTFGPHESLTINIRGGEGEPTLVVVRIYDLYGFYLGVETRTYYRQDHERRDVWIIRDRYHSGWY
jgi:hypothetical protein